ncbi:MAG TPA: YncE family protein [Candidatus Angelobacter sp.]
MMAGVGCQRPGVHTLQTATLIVGNSSQTAGDPTAVTTINPGTGNAEICAADGAGGPQPLIPPPGFAGVCNNTPQAGESIFNDFAAGPTYAFNFFSGVCLQEFSRGLGVPYTATLNVSPNQNGLYQYNVCSFPATALPAAGSHFATTDQLPPTVTVNGSGLSSSHGWPQLLVYDSTAAVVGDATASSVASDGSSVTFPFPAAISGGSLPSNTYMFAVKNFTSGGFQVPTATYFSLGGTVALSGAFGIDAGEITVAGWQCTPGTRGQRCAPGSLISFSSTNPVPIVTQYYANQAVFNGYTLATGSEPVAVRLYGSATITICSTATCQEHRTQPANAIVANSGSNTVTILNLVNHAVVTNVAVGTQPMGLTVNSAGTKAYVANYGSNSVYEIDLSTSTVSRTASVGSGPQSVAMDPGGSAVWVGGAGYLEKVDLTSFTVVSSVSVNGSVSSLAASNQQNELVYTLVHGCCSGSSNAAVTEYSLSSSSSKGTYASMSASAYAAYTMNGTLPTPSAIPGATQVSVQWGNGLAASATPTGFVIYDLVSHQQLMATSTATPVRGIASDPNNTVVYFTTPDSNKYITVPLPHL